MIRAATAHAEMLASPTHLVQARAAYLIHLFSSYVTTLNFQPPKPFLGVDHNIDVLNISPDGELRVSNLVFRRCQWWPDFDNPPSLSRISALLNLSKFSISLEKSSIFAVGCNFYAYISGSHEQDYTFMSGCISFCGNSSGLVNGSCSGLGCCHSAIPENTANYNLNVQSIYINGSGRTSGQSCGLGFIGETQAYNFSTLDFTNLTKRETVPLVLDWAVGNKTCKDAQKSMTRYLCKAANSSCSEPHGRGGYICKCPPGYQGNPYLPDEHKDCCQDIDECKDLDRNPCNATATCTNTIGNYTCICPNGYEGDGRMPPGTGCSRKGQSKIMIIALGVCISLLTLLVGSSLVYWVMQRRTVKKLKQKYFFKQNGGLILERHVAPQAYPKITQNNFKVVQQIAYIHWSLFYRICTRFTNHSTNFYLSLTSLFLSIFLLSLCIF
ncbi:wall-associated receptor kinase 2-like [Carya illinoinensis]|uniref:wall-associated receptor kinase 2-like n=1 Tax=Carya illinoinensis TaxID=32201 RepID=UPI001C728576|nr:wall-associated receptor kinase 2-like [Carya illinoinensis]XP_042963799.1 wall-associated receptor kinase 2-like [Carya illinoinensis]XP_042963800.1 wall-associated receptor kinase 2-like [Carya illinoinensis]